MISEIVYGVHVEGQEFTIRITPPKGKRQYRGYLTDAAKQEVGSGRWNSAEEADQALKELARRTIMLVQARDNARRLE